MSDANPAVRRLIRAKRALSRAASQLRGTPLEHYAATLRAFRDHAEEKIQAIQNEGKEPTGE